MEVRGHKLYNYKSFPYETMVNFPYFKGQRRDPCLYKSMICTFDIETTRLPEIDHSVMYVWQACVNGQVCVGRSWKEYKRFIQRLTADMPEDGRIIIFVHNLSYEFQFLRSVFHFKDGSVFMPSNRKILKAVTGKIEYRCSYLHSNMSLAEYTRKWGVEYQKVEGFDYDKPRFPWTPLSDFEYEYIVGDVIGLYEALRAEMAFDKDTLETFPLTSTGYVRRVLRANMKAFPKPILIAMQPDLAVFEMLNEAFRGGNCHANRYYSGEILEQVHSVDRSSSYPAVECCEDHYPIGRWKMETRTVDMRYVLTMIKRHNRCFVARVALFNLRLKDPAFGCPYLSRDKCRKIYCEDKQRGDYMYDNGRILYADYLETTITDVDLLIIQWEYDFNIEFIQMASCRAGRLPQPWIDTNLDYYTNKTELKNVEGQEIYYMKSKNLLNAIYGDTVQNPAKIRMVYKNDDFAIDDTSVAEALAESQKNPYKNFAWGVWVTAWARYRLEEVIQMAHHAIDPDTGLEFNGFVYSDTDSVKYIGELQGLDEYNEETKLRALDNDAWAKDPAGKVHYMGVYESEGTYDRFVTLGAKKYAYEQDGKLHITIAGVNKKLGAAELGSIENMHEGFTFREAGGLEAIYNDMPYGDVTIDGHRLRIGRNVCLKPSTYTIGLAEDYRRILSDPDVYLYIFDKKFYTVM